MRPWPFLYHYRDHIEYVFSDKRQSMRSIHCCCDVTWYSYDGTAGREFLKGVYCNDARGSNRCGFALNTYCVMTGWTSSTFQAKQIMPDYDFCGASMRCKLCDAVLIKSQIYSSSLPCRHSKRRK